MRKSNPRWVDAAIRPLPLRSTEAVASLSFLATFLTPYTSHLIPTAFKSLYSDVAFQYFAEMRSMAFRRPQDFVLMLLVMAAFLVLGRKHSLQIFEMLVLIGGTLVAFRIQRDGWMAVLPAIAILSGGVGSDKGSASPFPVRSFRWEKQLVAAFVTVTVAIAAVRLPHRNALMTKLGDVFPVKACDYISQNRLPPPLFDAYSWGSFLTWYLPDYPVAIDSRVDLYGNEILTRYFKVTSGSERLDVDPTLAAARTLLLERQSGMAKALTSLSSLSAEYRLVYSDNLAAVFLKQ